MSAEPSGRADLVVAHAELVETMAGESVPGGWVAITDGLVSGVGPPGTEPPADRTLDASGCLVTPGLVNTHHHIFQNLTRAHGPAANVDFMDWARILAPAWQRLDEEASYVSAWVGLAELALGGCTTTADHLYVHTHPKVIDAEIAASRDVGVRITAVRGATDVADDSGGVLPGPFVEPLDTVLADFERLATTLHDPRPDALARIAFGPGSPFDVSLELMRGAARLAERWDVRLHTHLLQLPDEDDIVRARFGFGSMDLLRETGWASDRTWLAHCIFPSPDDIAELGRLGVGVAHCPSSNAMICRGVAPVAELRAAGVPVGLGCDGSASTDHASLWLEARTAYVMGRLRLGPASMTARDVLDVATRGAAACLGRSGEIGELSVGACGDLVAWPLDGVRFAGAVTDPVESWLRCGPVSARHTVVGGRVVVEDGWLRLPGLDEMLRRHRTIAREWSAVAGS